ncbi:cytosolic phospholipase a2 epsilon-like [Limosa lapponica baueri]|uniref:phospholipase A2 n=1 Tax=Limosa lapponica baueri TaxID=1758121 RepID=A0A2I0TPS4_LIMLA|nr:cytosolic phospholipase a2 epsilon-like [Limosa lapponica baueri]
MLLFGCSGHSTWCCQSAVSQTDCYVKLWLPTASCRQARTRTVHNCRNPVWNEAFHFMIQREVKNILELTVCDEDTFTPDDQLLTVRFDVAKIQPGEKVHLIFELNPEDTMAKPGVSSRPLDPHCKNLDVRLGFDLCAEEQNFICKRKKVVAAALKNLLHLDEDLQEDEVPVVAVMTTAGGVRSMTAMFGSLLGLQESGVLDCVSYISGLSATTCKNIVVQSKFCLSFELLFQEWVEFTPYEVGFLKYGAFVRSEDFGSEFFMGHLMKKIPESRICFLEEYCLEHGIPFPGTELSQEDREHLKECYVFKDSLEAPIVAYFPLVCDTFQKYKAPNVERSPTEMEQGRVDVSNCVAPYGTGLLTYTEENFNKLLNLCSYNILNNKHLILQALRTAVERKKRFKNCSSPQSCKLS